MSSWLPCAVRWADWWCSVPKLKSRGRLGFMAEGDPFPLFRSSNATASWSNYVQEIANTAQRLFEPRVGETIEIDANGNPIRRVPGAAYDGYVSGNTQSPGQQVLRFLNENQNVVYLAAGAVVFLWILKRASR